MKAISALLLTGSLVLLLTGCTAYKHNKAGDAAAATGDMRSAVYHYEQAVAHKEKYSRDAQFLSKLSVARARVAYEEAQVLRNEGRYEPAIDLLREAMRQDPDYTKPGELLPIVQKEASRWRYTQAVAAADRGDLDAARDHLNRSMRHDLTEEASAYAMASLTPDLMPAQTPGLSDYRLGLSQSAERRWQLAEATLLKSVAANNGLLPARAALFEARAQLAEAYRLQRDGQALIDQLSMGPAIKSLSDSLTIWPFNSQASELLTHAKTQQTLANEQFNKATQAAGQAEWDDAIALADSGLTIDRSHPGLDELRGALPRRAAADHTHRGDGHLQQGELDPAYLSYNRALTYRETYAEARQGLAQVYAAWGQAHEQAGQLGAALLNYTKGQTYTQAKALDEGVLRTTALLRDRLGMGLTVSANEQRRGEIDPRQLSIAVLGSFAGKEALGLSTGLQAAPYELRLSISKATIDEQLTNTARRTHHYTTRELRHNAEYDRIAARLRSAERDYDRAVRDYQHAAGHGYDSHHSERDAHCNHHYNNINSARSRVDRLRRELSRTPHQIEVTLHHDWHYTVETYTKTGELSVVTDLIDTATGKAVKSFTHQATFAQSDDRTLNANPGVGLREDHLNLYDNDAVRDTLTNELANSAGPWAINALIDHQLAQISASIEAHEKQGQTAEAIEARVDSAILLGIVDPKGSQQAIDKLAQSQTR